MNTNNNSNSNSQEPQRVKIEAENKYLLALKSGSKVAGKALGQAAVTLGASAVMGFVMGKVISSGMKEIDRRRTGTETAGEALTEATQAIDKARRTANA